MLRLSKFRGNANVGVFARATDAYVLGPPSLEPGEREALREALEVPLTDVTIGGTSLVGSLVAANRHGAVVADVVTDAERAKLHDVIERVTVISHRLNAAGNNVLVNDKGGLCNPDLPAGVVDELSRALGVQLVGGTLAGLKTVGMAGVATNSGVLVHAKSTPQEQEHARQALGVEVMLGTINQGAGFVGAGLVANARGAVIGADSTAIEVSRIEDALGFLPPQPTA